MKRVIFSGYFNPLHGGHLDTIDEAAEMGDHLIVVVNNDQQQILKKGQIILDHDNRMRLMRSLRQVDEVILSVDQNLFQIETLKEIAKKYPHDDLVFVNGGDRDSEKVIPETAICEELGIELVFGLGRGKVDSSTRINQALGFAQ